LEDLGVDEKKALKFGAQTTHTFSYTNDLDYVTFETKLLHGKPLQAAEYRITIKSA
jgi:hypothetical protein